MNTKQITEIITPFDKREGEGVNYIHNEIISAISELYIDCPECSNIFGSDEQYQCTTCGGGSRINVLDWMKNEYRDSKNYKLFPELVKMLENVINEIELKRGTMYSAESPHIPQAKELIKKSKILLIN